MSFAVLTILLPLIAAFFLAGLGTPRQGATAYLVCTLLVFGGAIAAITAPGVALVHADLVGLSFGILTGFISLSAAIANQAFVRQHMEWLSPRGWRIYHAMGQLGLGGILLSLYADNILLVWLGAELAVIAGIVTISVFSTAAARKYLITGTAALAFAAFGTMLLYAAAQPTSPSNLDSLSFLALATSQLNFPLLILAFLFLLAGYGAIAVLAPLCAWHSEFPTPLTTSLAALTPNFALLAILRVSHLIHGQAAPFLLAAGLAGLAVTAFRLIASKNPMNSFAAFGASLGLFAFGIGGPAAIFGALLTMILAPLITTAAFQGPDQPSWLRAAALFAGSTLPPSGLFSASFIICGQTIQHRPLLAAPLILLLLLTATALLRRIPRAVVFTRPRRQDVIPALHLLLTLAIAFAMPAALVQLLSTAAAGLQ